MSKFSFVIFLLLYCVASPGRTTDVKGAGSAAAIPLYQNWARAYTSVSKDSIAYAGIGSAAGLKKVREHTVDFGATDVAIAPSDTDFKELICVPTSVTGVVPFVNLPGVKAGQIVLSGPVLADMYSGKIKSWNDSAIAALNPGKTLPNLPVNPVGRSDSSGSTYIFADYLAKTSPEWHDKYGANQLIVWATGVTQVKDSDAVMAEVRKTSGAIGYIDYGSILENHLTYISLQNRNKNSVEPTFIGFNAALLNSDWNARANFDDTLTDRSGTETWPITTATFILLPRITTNPEKTVAVMKFISWGFLHGDDLARKAGYVRLIDPLQAKIFGILLTVRDSNGQSLSWSPF